MPIKYMCPACQKTHTQFAYQVLSRGPLGEFANCCSFTCQGTMIARGWLCSEFGSDDEAY